MILQDVDRNQTVKNTVTVKSVSTPQRQSRRHTGRRLVAEPEHPQR